MDVLKDACKNNRGAAACQDKNLGGKNPIFGSEGILTKIINLVSILVGIAAVISIIVGAFKLITSGYNAQEVTTARELIIYALVGLILAAVAQLIVRLVLDKTGIV